MKYLKSPHQGFSTKIYPQGSITQFFAENPKLYKDCCQLSGHNGIDSVAPHGTPIRAVSDQKVVEVKEDIGGYGKHVRCIDDEFEYTYGHLSEINIGIGDQLKSGQQIGKMGNTGFVVSGSTPYWKYNPYAGTHLHLTLRHIQPYAGQGTWDISYATGDRAVLLSSFTNGFKGAVDPLTQVFIEPSNEEVITGIRLTLISLLNRAIKLVSSSNKSP